MYHVPPDLSDHSHVLLRSLTRDSFRAHSTALSSLLLGVWISAWKNIRYFWLEASVPEPVLDYLKPRFGRWLSTYVLPTAIRMITTSIGIGTMMLIRFHPVKIFSRSPITKYIMLHPKYHEHRFYADLQRGRVKLLRKFHIPNIVVCYTRASEN